MSYLKPTLSTLVLLLFSILLTLPLHAAVPSQISFQGQLTDEHGLPVPDADYPATFSLYEVESGGTPLWSEAQTVSTTNGNYSVILGQPGNEIDPADIDGSLWLGVAVGSDTEMTPRLPLTSTAFALKAALSDSLKVGAVNSAMLATSAVTTDAVADGAITSSKVAFGAVTSAQIADGTVTAADINDGSGSGLNADQLDGHEAADFATTVTIAQLEARIVALEAKLQYLILARSEINGMPGPHMIIEGANLHVRSGSGNTEEAVNGLGNLIIGYNELHGSSDNDRTGSHNIITGMQNSYSSYGGLVAGKSNTLSGPFASVSGGLGNKASGPYASVSGGVVNEARGQYASVSGGWLNVASGETTSITGGSQNEASGKFSVISGGYINRAAYDFASVNGGTRNIANGWSANVSGGHNNKAIGHYSFIGGGGGIYEYEGNITLADHSAILGGSTNGTGDVSVVWIPDSDHLELVVGTDRLLGAQSTINGGWANITKGPQSNISSGKFNITFGKYTSILGGLSNFAGDYALEDHEIGAGASVSGGAENIARGGFSNISGGKWNRTFGNYSFVGGGGGELFEHRNMAHAHYSAVLGGASNIAGDITDQTFNTGTQAAVSGGLGNEARGNSSSVSGGKNNVAEAGYSNVSSGEENRTTGWQSSVSGGYQNVASGTYSAVEGGYQNVASGTYSAVGGGSGNVADGSAQFLP